MNTCLCFLLSFVLLSGVLRPAHAYSRVAACSWLEFSPSTAANGMGNLASPYSTDLMTAWFLPGVSVIGPGAAEGVTVEFSGYRPRTDWLPGFEFDGISFGHKAVRFRAPMDKALDQISRWVPGFRWRPSQPMSLSFSLMHQNLGYNTIPWRNERGDVVTPVQPKEWSTSARMEIGWHRRLWNFGAGLGFDYISSDFDRPILLDDQIIGRNTKGKAGTFDWGLVAERKLLDRVPLNADGFQPASSPLHLDLGVTGSWARNFFGGEMQYSGAGFGDPLPRKDRVALASRLRVVHPGSGAAGDMDLLCMQVAYEHSTTLINKYLDRIQINGIRDTDPGGSATDINSTDEPDRYFYVTEYRIFEPDIFGMAEDINRGWGAEVSLYNMLTIRRGRYDDHDSNIRDDTQGWGLDSNGLFRLIERGLPGAHSKPVLGWMLRCLRVRYDKAEWESNSLRDGTQFRQVTVDVAF